jgi:long-subunit fatty acid transport protein
MHFSPRLHVAFCATLCAFLLGFLPSASGQTNTENFAQFEFNFNNPGARAGGIGGAFISIADDATAAEANPAGLTNLIRPEFSVEFKGLRFKRDVNNFSHIGTAQSYTLQSREFDYALASPSFASIVVPVSRLTLSAFRYELVNYKFSYYTEGSYVPPLTDGHYFFPVSSTLDMKIVNWGAAVAYKFRRIFSIGASFGLSRISMSSSLSRYFVEVFDPGALANVSTIEGTQNEFFVNGGVLVQPRENLAIGAVVKVRPHFTLQNTFRFTNFPQDSSKTKEVNFFIPNSIGAGISYRPVDVLTLAFDADWVSYSRMTKDFKLSFLEFSSDSTDYKADDGFELHFGAEYVKLFRSFGMVFRGGIFTEPDKTIHWVGKINDSNNPDRVVDRTVLAALFQKGETVIHFTFGVGFIVSNNFQVDFAGNISKTRNEVIGSLVARL